MNEPKLSVFWGRTCVGYLWLDDKKRLVFHYKAEFLSSPEALPISLSLPLQADPFSDDLSRPFFSNLLPEAEIRKAIAKKLGLSAGNDYALLEALGGECAGAISVWPGDKIPSERNDDYHLLSVKELEQMIRALPKPMLLDTKGVRLSLAGAQHKLPVYMKAGKIFLPKGALSSSHILKPQIPGFQNSVENEAFCMRLAREVGLIVPNVSILKSQVQVFAIERYDRSSGPNGLERIHQEDFCQALGILPDQKYESEGGPSLKSCFSLIARECKNPLQDKIQLLRWVVFNFLIGNSDAHGKNLSILIENGEVRLSPFYDLMSTAVYDELSDKMAMKIGGEYRPERVHIRHWERFAEEIEAKPQNRPRRMSRAS